MVPCSDRAWSVGSGDRHVFAYFGCSLFRLSQRQMLFQQVTTLLDMPRMMLQG